MSNSDSELSQISDYEDSFDHDNGVTDNTHAAVHNISKVKQGRKFTDFG